VSLDDVPDALLITGLLVALSFASLALHQLERWLEKRGQVQAARALGALRAFLTTDAPAVAERLASAYKGRQVVSLDKSKGDKQEPKP
jgi:hypothetical protein